MFKKTIKILSMTIFTSLIFLSLYGCDNTPWTEPTHDSANVLNENQNEKIEVKEEIKNEIIEESIPTFEEAINSIKEKSIWKLEETINEEINKFKNNEVKNESEWEFNVVYWDTNWKLKISFSWLADNSFENILSNFKINLLLNNANLIDEEFPKKLNIWWSYSVLLEGAKQYFIQNEINIDDLKGSIIEDKKDEKRWEGINKIIDTLKGKWIELNQEKLCDENSQEYSEAWCEISKSTKAYTEILSGWNKEEIEWKVEEIIKTTNAISDAIKASIFSTEVLTLEKQVEYEWNQAYKFTINKTKLKNNMKKTLKTYAEYYAEKQAKRMQEFYSTYWDEYGMTEDDIKEMKDEISEGIDEMFEEISKNVTVKNFDAYLVYDKETKSFDVVVEKLNIQIKTKNEICDYKNMYNWDEYIWPRCKDEEKIHSLSIAFSSKKHLFIFVWWENNKTTYKLTIWYNLTPDQFNIKVSYAWNDDNENYTEDLIVINAGYWKKETWKILKNKMSVEIKLKKELLNLKNDLNIGFNAQGQSIYWEKIKFPTISNPIPFYKVEKFIEKIEKEYFSTDENEINWISIRY